MLNKQKQIEAKQIKPIVVGDVVGIVVPYTTKELVTEGRGKNKITKEVEISQIFRTDGRVEKIYIDLETQGLDGKSFIGKSYQISIGSIRIPTEVETLGVKTTYKDREKCCTVNSEYVKPTYYECGSNPFAKEKVRVNFYNQDIASLLFKACYGRRDGNFENPVYSTHSGNGTEHDKAFKGITHGGVNFNPFVIDAEGNKQFYQRELIWTLEQKQLLIDSIYNGIEIGKFLFRYNTWSKIEEGMTNDGHGYSWDCVDGKQRFMAILHFVQNKYPDSYGNYWNDLSENAQGKLLNYHNLSYGEMGESTKDSDVVDTFLTMNHSGVPMSKEHIEYVQQFRMKS
jgi:hypothetical protein